MCRKISIGIMGSLLCLIGFPIYGQTPTDLVPERLQRIDQVVDSFVTHSMVPGAVILVQHRGKPVHFKAYGWADKAQHIPLQKNSLFRLASMSKALTSVAAMMLFEEGKLTLDDPVSRWIPAFAEMKVLVSAKKYGLDSVRNAKKPITIRHLLTHSSGLVYHWNGKLGKAYIKAGVAMGLKREAFSTREGMERLAKLPLQFEPGKRWQYGLNTDVLGAVIEKVSGMPLDKFMQQRLFAPLEMHSTWFQVPDTAMHRMSQVYARTSEHELVLRPEDSIMRAWKQPFTVDYAYPGEPLSYFSGGGGLISTAGDYANFLQMLLNKGAFKGKQILSPRTVAFMLQDHTANMGYKPGKGFGLGLEVIQDPDQNGELAPAGEFWWGGFFSTHFWVDPNSQLIMISMTQLYPDRKLQLHKIVRNLSYLALK